MSEAIRCAMCSAIAMRHDSYVVRIDVFADPATEPIDTQSSSSEEGEDPMQAVMNQLQEMSTEDAMDDIHRRFEFHLCHDCQRAMLSNPLGLPRATARTWDGRN